jgi:hypothetical protein
MRLGTRVVTLTIAALATVSLLAQQPQAPQPPAGGGRGGFGGGADARGQFPLPPRDTAPAPTGTARIRGRVIAADSGAPLRRAQVRLTSQDARTAKSATTDTEGRFELADLPAGRYTLTVSKAGYLTLQYGQRRPLERGRPIDLTDAQVLERTDVLLPRGGAVTGRIVDEYGEPLADATVQALRYQYVGGQRQLVPAGRSAQTDDLGQYRIYGLPPGDYYITAATRTPMAAFQAAVVAVPPPTGGPLDAGVMGLQAAQAMREALGGSDDDVTGYAPSYYPGTTTLSDAQRVTIGIAEDMPGISFAMTVAKLARISGTVVDSQGQALARGMVMIRPRRGGGSVMFFRAGATNGVVNGGAFTVNGVPPGDYILQVRTAGPGSGVFGGPGRADAEFANAPISINGSDIEGMVIATSKGATISGHVTFNGSRAPSSAAMLVTAVAAEPDQMPIGPGGLNGRVSTDGTFELRGLSGPNMFRVGNPPSGWTLRAVLFDGVDITDTPREFKGGETVTGLEIELSDKPTRITGAVTDTQNQAIQDYAVVVFSNDRDQWIPQSRFVRAGRPDQEGRFQMAGLPPGRYLAVALQYLEQGSEMDPELLEQLRLKATDFTLREGETHQLDLKLSF